MQKPAGRARTTARLAAVQALFQVEQGPENPDRVIEQFILHRLLPHDGGFDDGMAPEANGTLFESVVRAATDDQAALDALISATLPADWKLERLDPVLRAVLRAGAAELRMENGPPGKVVINEYVDVANGFFQGDETGMANAVLDKLARQLREQDFPIPPETVTP